MQKRLKIATTLGPFGKTRDFFLPEFEDDGCKKK
jgi:hypothetical protein